MRTVGSLFFTVVAVALLTACASSSLTEPSGCPSGRCTIAGRALLAGESSHAGIVVTTVGGSAYASAITNDRGEFSLSLLADGTYGLVFTAASTLQGSQTVTATVAGANVVLPDITFTPTGVVSGSATRAGSSSGNVGIQVAVAGTSIVAYADDAGSYTLSTVPAGTRDLVASLAGYSPAVARGISVSYKGTALAPALSLSPVERGRLKGFARYVGLSSHSGITVSIDGRPEIAATAQDGSYVFDSLPSGVYALKATAAAYQAAGVTNVPVIAGGSYSAPDIELRIGRRLTTDTGSPVVSPDEALVGYFDTLGTLKSVPVAGGAPTALESSGGGALTFSSDSSRLSFYSWSSGELRVVPAMGGAGSALARSDSFWDAVFSQPMDMWVYRAWNAGQGSLQSVTLAGVQTNINSQSWTGSLGVRPDGRRVVYQTGFWPTTVWSASTSAPVAPVAFTLSGMSPPSLWQNPFAFTPNNSSVVIQTTAPPYQLCSAPSDGGAAVTLLSSSTAWAWVSTSPDSLRVLAATGTFPDYTLQSSLVASSTPATVATGVRNAAWAAGGAKVVYLTGAGDLKSSDPDGTGTTLLASGVANFATSPAGSAVAYATAAGRAFVAPAGGGAAVQLSADAGSWSFTFSPDASRVVGRRGDVLYSFTATGQNGAVWDNRTTAAPVITATNHIYYSRVAPGYPDSLNNGIYVGALP